VKLFWISYILDHLNNILKRDNFTMIQDTLLNELKAELRSILISSQQGCNEQQLMKDYAAYNSNREIPFRQMGFKTLIELLRSMPDVADINFTRSPIVIFGVPDKTTMHIDDMVRNQKRKKKPASARSNVNRGGYTNYRMNNPNSYARSRPVSTVFYT